MINRFKETVISLKNKTHYDRKLFNRANENSPLQDDHTESLKFGAAKMDLTTGQLMQKLTIELNEERIKNQNLFIELTYAKKRNDALYDELVKLKEMNRAQTRKNESGSYSSNSEPQQFTPPCILPEAVIALQATANYINSQRMFASPAPSPISTSPDSTHDNDSSPSFSMGCFGDGGGDN